MFKRVVPLVIVLLAFAVRVLAMDTAWIDGDRANPHGLGIIALDVAARGDWANFPLFSDDASIGLPNPPLLTYLYALAAATGRSLSMANALGLIANTLAVAAAFGIGRRAHSWMAGALAATLMAGSNWGVFMARGTWHPTPLEPGLVFSAWLLLAGATRQRTRLQLAGFILAAATAFSYVTAFVLLAQAPLAVRAAGGAWRGFVRGALICTATLALYVVLLAAGGRLSNLASIGLLRPAQPVTSEADLRARDITPENRSPLGHFLRLATNASYAVTWTEPSLPGYALRRSLEDVQSTALSVAVLAGLVMAMLRLRRAPYRFLLVWALVPLSVLYVLVLRRDDFRVAPYYLLFTSPVAHVLAGVSMASLLKRVRASAATCVALCAMLSIIPAWNFAAAAQTVYAAPFNGVVDFMPLRWSQRLGRLWRDQCPRMIIDNFWWAISLRESSNGVRRGALRQNEISTAWSIDPNGGTCALKQIGPPPPNAELLALTLEDGSVLRTYRALPYRAPAEAQPLPVNLGWTLLDHSVTPTARAGATLTVTHAWRIDMLPSEPHASWFYAPFVKLISADGAVIIDINGASALEGWAWQPGEIISSDVTLSLPAGLPPGEYTVQSSLFDPNQKKNAVYFDPARPGEPILTLTRQVVVER